MSSQTSTGSTRVMSSKDLDLAEKKRRRLERNRESARECRKRKKEKKIMLRQELALLEAQNLQLRLQLQVGSDQSAQEDKSHSITSRLENMIKEGASESEIQKSLQELQERFSDYGRDRRSAIDFHIAQLKRCLQPTQTTRAILWLLSCAPLFHDANGQLKIQQQDELSELWMSLLQTLKPNDEQTKQLISFTSPSDLTKDPFNAVRFVTDNCNNMLARLVEIIGNKNESLDNEMANVQAILTPRQIAKFLLWIDQNPACMQMLEALWPHLTHSNQKKRSKRSSSINDNLDTLIPNSISSDNLADISEEEYYSSEEDET